MGDHRSIRELLGPHVLGQLDGEEGQEVERHLRSCPLCRKEAEELLKTQRALSKGWISPPPELKDRLMEGLPARPPLRRGGWAPPPRRVPITAAAAAAVALVAVLLAASYVGFFRPQETVAETAPLSPTHLAPEASGEVRVQGRGPDVRVSLEVSGLPRLGPDEYYELWFVDGKDRISAGGFTVDSRGRATVSMNAPRPASEYPGVGITREESPGDPRPSPTKVLGGVLNQA